MKRLICVTSAVLLCAATASAQPLQAGQKRSLVAALQGGYNNIKMNLTQSADKLADADYAFKVGPQAETRTFGQLFGHVANSQYNACAAAKGVANPNQGKNLEQDLKTKAEITKALADSFAFCDDAFSSLTDANAMEYVKQGQGEVQRVAVLAGLVTHSNEMYGTSAAYLRAKGIVPPSTERQGMRGRRGGL